MKEETEKEEIPESKYKAKRIFMFLAQKIAGLSGLQIAAVLASNGSMSAEKIAELTGIQVAVVRDILERLHANGILFTTRIPSTEYHSVIFKYYFDEVTVLRAFRDKLKSMIIHLTKISEYRGTFYYCPMCNRYYSEEVAAENDYQCPVCGSELEEKSDLAIEFRRLRRFIDELKTKFVQTMYI